MHDDCCRGSCLKGAPCVLPSLSLGHYASVYFERSAFGQHISLKELIIPSAFFVQYVEYRSYLSCIDFKEEQFNHWSCCRRCAHVNSAVMGSQ